MFAKNPCDFTAVKPYFLDIVKVLHEKWIEEVGVESFVDTRYDSEDDYFTAIYFKDGKELRIPYKLIPKYFMDSIPKDSDKLCRPVTSFSLVSSTGLCPVRLLNIDIGTSFRDCASLYYIKDLNIWTDDEDEYVGIKNLYAKYSDWVTTGNALRDDLKRLTKLDLDI
jgi:hypothetical protein